MMIMHYNKRLVSLNQSSVGYVSIYLQILDQSRQYWQMGGKNTWKVVFNQEELKWRQ